MSNPDEELTTMSYRAVGLGLPVVTHSGQQFGVVEHVLEVPEPSRRGRPSSTPTWP